MKVLSLVYSLLCILTHILSQLSCILRSHYTLDALFRDVSYFDAVIRLLKGMRLAIVLFHDHGSLWFTHQWPLAASLVHTPMTFCDAMLKFILMYMHMQLGEYVHLSLV